MLKARPLNLTGVRQTDDTSRQVQNILRWLFDIPIINGVLLEIDPTTNSSGITFTSTQTRTLKHGLGRVYRGFIVAGNSGGTPAQMRSIASGDDADMITLRNDALGTSVVRIWVY